jgi:hypothetical protein
MRASRIGECVCAIDNRWPMGGTNGTYLSGSSNRSAHSELN